MGSTAPFLLPPPDQGDSLLVCSQESLQSLGARSVGRRPKLTLTTSGLTASYNASTINRVSIDTAATTTPTTLNTFTNTFDLAYRPSPVSTISSPATLAPRKTNSHQPSPHTRSPAWPYSLNLPFGLHSILKNGPIPRDNRRPLGCSASPCNWMPGKRIFFPPPKKVTFRAVLEEEIVTTEYVRCHAEVSSSEDETGMSEIDEESTADTDTGNGGEDPETRTIRVDEYIPRGRRKRKSVTSSERLTGDQMQGRCNRLRSTSARRIKRKKRRWEWTAEFGPAGNGFEARRETEALGDLQTATSVASAGSNGYLDQAVHVEDS